MFRAKLRVSQTGRVTEPRSHVASKVQETVRGIRQADRQRYVVFESLAYQLTETPAADCRMEALVRETQRSPEKADHRDTLPDRLRRSCAAIVGEGVQRDIDLAVGFEELIVIGWAV